MGYSSSLERNGYRRVHWCQQVEGADSHSTHSLQHRIWNTRTSSGLPSTRDTCLLEWVLRKATKMLQELEDLSYEEKPSKKKLFSWEKWKFGRECVEYPPCEYLHLHLMGESKGDRNILLSKIQWQAKRQWRKKNKYRKFQLNLRTVRMVKDRNRLPWKTTHSPSSKTVKIQLDNVQSNLLWFFLLWALDSLQKSLLISNIPWSSPFVYKTK